ncbi:hypothetical protein S83_038218, partial [Arachis hypogaea]
TSPGSPSSQEATVTVHHPQQPRSTSMEDSSRLLLLFCSSPTAHRLLLVSRHLRSPSVPLLCSSL